MKYLFTYLINVLLIVLLCSFSCFAGNSKKILINEFLASNKTGIVDEDGDRSEWIELYNPGSTTINLLGWGLSDNENKPYKWVFPSISISSGQYLVVFTSGKNRKNVTRELHTNFSLANEGEYLGIVEPNGTVSDEYAPMFPPQRDDVSYGYYLGEPTYFTTPTPGAENTIENQAMTPKFSVGRGFYNTPFTVTLTTNDPNTKIYYTTDGIRPTASSTLYTEPIHITTTTPLSAVGIKGNDVSLVIAHTYFFIQDIIRQSATPAGYPDRWGVLGGSVTYAKYKVGERAPAHYAMNQTICNDSRYKGYLNEAFLSIPSVSIVTDPGYFFSAVNDPITGGIYIHTGVANRTGVGWERPISMEYYDPSSGKQFQINCGIRTHGAASREPEKTGKHSFRVYFRKIYETGKLHFDLFEDEGSVNKFDYLVFRSGFNCSWTHHSSGQSIHSQYVSDPFAKRTQRAMGQTSTHDRFVHLFINGLYWGMYNISELIRSDYLKEYLGGEKEHYDIMSHGGLAEGQRTSWDRMLNLAQTGKYADLKSEDLLFMENYIDYLLVNFYMGNWDWGNNNWYAAINRVNHNGGFRFFSWDAESSFFQGVSYNLVSGKSGNWNGSNAPTWRMMFGASGTSGLLLNDDFKLLFADRVQKHLFNGGALTPEKTAELYRKLSNEIDLPIILESARWGSYRREVLPGDGTFLLYNRNDHLYPKQKYLYDTYFPQRTDILYNQLKALGLAYSIKAPVFNPAGGAITNLVDVRITAEAGSIIYYTVDGSDPRQSGTGNVAASAKKYTAPLRFTQTVTVKARARLNSAWSALSEISFTYTAPPPPPPPVTSVTNEPASVNPLQAWMRNGLLHVTGLTVGKMLCVYNSSGALVYYSIAIAKEIDIPLSTQGIYVIQSDNNTIKVLFEF